MSDLFIAIATLLVLGSIIAFVIFMYKGIKTKKFNKSLLRKTAIVFSIGFVMGIIAAPGDGLENDSEATKAVGKEIVHKPEKEVKVKEKQADDKKKADENKKKQSLAEEKKAKEEKLKEQKQKEEKADKEKQEAAAKAKKVKELEKKEKPKEVKKVAKPKKKKIDTSNFKAKKVEVTDAIDLNDHVSLIVRVDESVPPALAFVNTASSMYDFLQQDSIKGAKTVGVNVVQGKIKQIMFTVHTDQFKPNPNVPMADLVMEASEVDVIQPEVEDYAKMSNIPINK